MNSGPPSPVSREQLTRRIRSQLQLLLHDQSGDVPVGVAIYTLSDPRDVRDVRYGPPATESRSNSPAKRSAAANGKKKDGVLAEPPRIEMPKLDFAFNSTDHGADLRANDPWLS